MLRARSDPGMDPLKLEPTIDTPYVVLDKINGMFAISGKSYPEDTREFYGSILAWLDLYVADPNPETKFVFQLKYFNSSSYKPIYDIITKLATLKKKGMKVSVQWNYKEGDNDMLEAGEEFRDLFTIDFSFSPM